MTSFSGLLFLCENINELLKTCLNRPLSEYSEKDTATFLVKGTLIGQTSISAFVTDKNGKTISSAPQQIEVKLLATLPVLQHLRLGLS